MKIDAFHDDTILMLAGTGFNGSRDALILNRNMNAKICSKTIIINFKADNDENFFFLGNKITHRPGTAREVRENQNIPHLSLPTSSQDSRCSYDWRYYNFLHSIFITLF
ncbi:hypothetical protein ABEB36_003900 [Hypothenemus hampei]|uniref:Uncharacterized protein n=1 Tax=Hypothenemus hampei TaxID=57062 RepID=A0ABD1F1G8_HYPHA